MRLLLASVVLAGAGFLAAQATADVVPIPGVPTVTVPTTPVPLPAIPKLPAPALPAPPAPVSHAATSVAAGAQAALSSSPTAVRDSYSSGSSSSSSYQTAQSRPTAVKHFHSSRPWIGTSGSKKRRTTTFTFVLPAASRVVFTVNQVSPACRGEGRFTVRGHAGLNRVRFAGRIHGRQLGPGTYRISARTHSGRVVQRAILVIVAGGAPSSDELAAARASNACQGTTAADDSTASAPSRTTGAVLASQPQASVSALPVPTGPNVHSGVLASAVEKTAEAVRPLFVALLAAAILLLGVASLPQTAVAEPRVNDLLARPTGSRSRAWAPPRSSGRCWPSCWPDGPGNRRSSFRLPTRSWPRSRCRDRRGLSPPPTYSRRRRRRATRFPLRAAGRARAVSGRRESGASRRAGS
jgi:hypothetical protein